MNNTRQYKIFNITQKRPKVLLFGNGLTYSEETTWEKVITSLAKDDENKKIMDGIPYSLAATVTTSIDDNERHNKYDDFFEGKNPKKYYQYRECPILEQFLNLPFDAILTTNYSYEAENILCDGYSNYKNDKKRKYAYTTSDKPDGKYLLHGFNRFHNDKNYVQDIWHIHGEARRKSSMILTHDEYARLITEIVNYNKAIGKNYFDYQMELKFKSWIDYFILGDLYIVGQGFDFSEFDLWWLLNRRMKEKTGQGKTWFFTPKDEKKDGLLKDSILEQLGVVCKYCKTDKLGKDVDYAMFYEKVLEELKKELY